MIRHQMMQDATVAARNAERPFGARIEAALTHVSRHGCAVHAPSNSMKCGQFVHVCAPAVPTLGAQVGWVDGEAVGIQFDYPLGGCQSNCTG